MFSLKSSINSDRKTPDGGAGSDRSWYQVVVILAELTIQRRPETLEFLVLDASGVNDFMGNPNQFRGASNLCQSLRNFVRDFSQGHGN